MAYQTQFPTVSAGGVQPRHKYYSQLFATASCDVHSLAAPAQLDTNAAAPSLQLNR